MRRGARGVALPWFACGNEADLFQGQASRRFLRQTQMAEMYRVEGAAENTDAKSTDGIQNLTPHMPVTQHHILLRR